MTKLKIIFIIVTIYWFFSTIALLDIIHGSGNIFPFGLSMILFPGYFLGFALGYGGGEGYAILGQLIVLLVIVIIYFVFYKIIKK